MKHISTQLVSWVLILPSIDCTLTKQWVSIQNNDNINYVINVLTRNSLFVNVDLINSIHSASNSGALSSDSDWWWSSLSAGCGSRGSASSFVGSDGLIAFFCFGFPSERILRGLLLLEIQWAMAGLGSNDFMSHLIRLTLMRSWRDFCESLDRNLSLHAFMRLKPHFTTAVLQETVRAMWMIPIMLDTFRGFLRITVDIESSPHIDTLTRLCLAINGTSCRSCWIQPYDFAWEYVYNCY